MALEKDVLLLSLVKYLSSTVIIGGTRCLETESHGNREFFPSETALSTFLGAD